MAKFAALLIPVILPGACRKSKNDRSCEEPLGYSPNTNGRTLDAQPLRLSGFQNASTVSFDIVGGIPIMSQPNP
jgi:hypothetical protein